MSGNYHKIYEQHYGMIPWDQNGRRYEIHHIDGDHSNNTISNLKAVTIEEHFAIHNSQNDYGACLAIGIRMKISPAELKILAKKSALKRVENGTCPLLGGNITRASNKKRVADGTHNFLGDKNPARQKVKNGTHHWLGGDQQKALAKQQKEKGTLSFLVNNPSHIKIMCPHCEKVGAKGPMMQWHFDNCKHIRKIA